MASIYIYHSGATGPMDGTEVVDTPDAFERCLKKSGVYRIPDAHQYDLMRLVDKIGFTYHLEGQLFVMTETHYGPDCTNTSLYNLMTYATRIERSGRRCSFCNIYNALVIVDHEHLCRQCLHSQRKERMVMWEATIKIKPVEQDGQQGYLFSGTIEGQSIPIHRVWIGTIETVFPQWMAHTKAHIALSIQHVKYFYKSKDPAVIEYLAAQT